jgi:hypoxanthine phosphoribosyltransferase
VLLVEDIVDTGLTLQYLQAHLRSQGPPQPAHRRALRQAVSPPGPRPRGLSGL